MSSHYNNPPPPPPPPSNMGQQNVAQGVEVMELTAESQAQRAAHHATLQDLELQKIASSLTTVPTLAEDVRSALREMGQPVRLFGENLADVRQRLRMAMARQELQQRGGLDTTLLDSSQQQQQRTQQQVDEEEEQVTKYTRAPAELVEARQAIARFSIDRARERLEREKQLRALALQHRKRKRLLAKSETNDATETEGASEDDLEILNDSCTTTYSFLRKVGLEGSQYGDSRALSAICTTKYDDSTSLCITSSWTASIHAWNAGSPTLDPLGKASLCHEDRIMSMDCQQRSDSEPLLATGSIDKTAKLFKITKAPDVVMEDPEGEGEGENQPDLFSFAQLQHFQGHEARLCRTAFHPMKRHLGTSSFDHTWRLWDIETGQSLLLQDGHADKVFAMSFHKDGSICATADFASVIQLWDLRTGKSILHFANAHAKRILTSDFSPNGFQLATAGDDGTIKIFDLRRRKQAVSGIPAHSQLISKVRFDDDGEFLVSSSFDGTAKTWSARDWKMLNCLRAHQGQVSGVDIVPPNGTTRKGQVSSGIVTCGFDKTLKYWA